MNTKKLFIFALFTNALSITAFASDRQQQGKSKVKQMSFLGAIDTSVRFSKARNMGEINVLSPYEINENSVEFINYIGKRSNKGGMEFNLGLAKRQLKNNKIYGEYIYFDVRKTPTGNSFGQLTVGKEILSKQYDLRFNGYFPLSEKKEITNKTTNIQADNNGNITAITEDYEVPMMGFDVEYGKLIKQRSMEFGGWLGYYNFRPVSGNAENVIGGRLRMEYRMSDILSTSTKLIFGLEMQKDKARGSQNILSFRVSIPFGKVRKLNKQGQSYYNQRILEPIIRDIDIVTGNNAKTEQIIDTRTNKPLNKVIYVSSQQELSDAIVLGDKNQIIVITKDFKTGSMLMVGKGQIITSGSTGIKFTTPSGYTGTYKPSSGKQKSITAKHKSQKPISMGNLKNLRGVTLYSRNYKNELLREDISLLGGSRTVVKKGDIIDGAFNGTGTTDKKKYSLICYNGSEIFDASYCDGSITIDETTGKITISKDFSGQPLRVFKVLMTNSDKSKVESGLNVFSDSTAKASAKKVQDKYLPNSENYRGIKLLYGNDYKCTKDNGKYGKASCGTTGLSKLDHVKRTIDGILDNIAGANGKGASDKIEKALQLNGAVMTLFNNDDDKENGVLLYSQYASTQDLQATESFSTADDSTKGKGAGGADDATLEEVLHLVQNYGISQANPEWQDKIVENMEKYSSDVKFTDTDPNDGYDDDGDNLPLRDLNTEYFAGALESYYNIHSREVNIKGSSVCLTGSADVSKNCSTGKTSRGQLKANHRNTYDLLEQMFGKGDKFFK